MLAETLILLLVVLPFLGAIAATTMPVSARNGEVVLGGGVMLADALDRLTEELKRVTR